jgi:signal transduction histidine kinase
MGLQLLNNKEKESSTVSTDNGGNGEIIDDMISSCEVAVDILNDLLLYEKIDSNLLSIEVKEYSLHDVLTNFVQNFNIQVCITITISSIDKFINRRI